MALTSFWTLPKGGFQVTKTDSVADFLLSDEIEKAEALLDKQPETAEALAFRGEIQFRRGDFSKADSLYRQAIRLNDKTAYAHFGLGKLALAKLNAKEAISQFKRAIEIAPKEALFHWYATDAYGIDKNYNAQKAEVDEYLKFATNDPDRIAEAKATSEMIDKLGKDIGAITAPEAPAPIPFQKAFNLIFTQITIDGKGPYRFAIDTGATQVVVSEKLANDLGLKAITNTVMHGVGGGGKVDSKLYRVGELRLGDIKVTNLPVGTFNDPLVTQLADGILGTATLSDFVITVNYEENRLELSKKVPTVPAERLDAWYFSNLLLIPLEINGKFHGNFVVDTGAVTTVLSHAMAAKLGVTENTPGAKVDVGVSGVGGVDGSVLRVPDVTLKTGQNTEVFPQVVSIDLKDISKMIGTEISGVVGFDFLQGYRVILNYGPPPEVRLAK
jgi:predicted aspartyl protease